MAKDKKKPVQQDEKMPAEAHETVEQNSAENRAENSEDNGGVTLSKDEFERAKAEIERMNAEIETLKKSADEAIGDAQRIQAEFNNFRKRNASVRAESYDDGIRETVKTSFRCLIISSVPSQHPTVHPFQKAWNRFKNSFSTASKERT